MPNPDHNVQRTHRQPQLQHQQPQQQMHTKLHQPQQHALPRHEPAQAPMRDAWRNERLEHTRLHRRIISNQSYTHDEPPAPDYDLPEDWDYVDDEYAEEYEAYMFQLEAKSYPIVAHMDMQPEITWDMRRVLLDFLVQVHSQCRLRPETFFLTVNIMDRYLTRRIVRRIHYQLLGMVCLWAAAKYEDVKDNVPTVHDLWFMCQSSYAEKEFVSMEAHVVHFLRFDLGYPTQEAWMKYFLAKGDGKMKPDDEPEWRGHCRWGLTPEGRKRVHNVARLIAEVACFHRQYVAWPASVLAKCALHLAVHILGLPQPSPQALQQCFPYICELEAALASASAVVLHKYSHSCLSNATEAVNSYLASGSTIKPTAAAPPPAPPSWALPRHHQRGTSLERSRTTCGPWAAAAETTAAHAGGNLALQLLRRETFGETHPQRQQQQQQQQQQQPHYPTVQQQSHHHHHNYLSFQQRGQGAGRRFCDLFASSSSSSSAVFPRAAAAAVPACGPPTPITPTMMSADPGGGNEAAYDWARAALDRPRMAHCPAALPPPLPPPERAATRFPSVVGATALYNCS